MLRRRRASGLKNSACTKSSASWRAARPAVAAPPAPRQSEGATTRESGDGEAFDSKLVRRLGNIVGPIQEPISGLRVRASDARTVEHNEADALEDRLLAKQ